MKKIVCASLALLLVGGGLGLMSAKEAPMLETKAETSETLRIWIDRDIHYTNGYIYGIHYWNDSGDIDKHVYASDHVDFGVGVNDYLAMVDVNEEIIGCNYQLVVKDSNTDEVKEWFEPSGSEDNRTPFAEGTNNQIFYIWYTETGEPAFSLGARNAASATDVNALARVLEAYKTCDSSVSHGYNAIPQLINTWIHSGTPADATDATWYISGFMSDVKITDYASGDTTYAGEKTTEYTLQDKYDEMVNQYLANSVIGTHYLTSNFDMISTTGILVFVAATSIVGLTIVVSKKRRVNCSK